MRIWQGFTVDGRVRASFTTLPAEKGADFVHDYGTLEAKAVETVRVRYYKGRTYRSFLGGLIWWCICRQVYTCLYG